MKELILNLIKKYYNLCFVVREVNIMGEGSSKTIRITDTRASVSYQVLDNRERPDDVQTAKKQEEERERLAEQLFQLTKNILLAIIDKKTNKSRFDLMRDKEDIRTFANHNEKMSWVVRNLIRERIISPYEYVDQEETLDEDGDFIGYTRLKSGNDFAEDFEEKE